MLPEQETVVSKILPELFEVFRSELGFESFTPAQLISIKHFLAKKDVIVQAPTGSGKTIAYVLPTVQMLVSQKKTWTSNEIGALILLPTRELAQQVSQIVDAFAKPAGLAKFTMISGLKKIDEDIKNFKTHGGNILIATPGRLEAILGKFPDIKKQIKSLEVLVLDECDRFIDLGFQKSVTEILAVLPKQRRTGLFSATQAKEIEEMVKFGLRNPIHLKLTDTALKSSSATGKIEDGEEIPIAAPDSLTNYYAIVPADQKLSALVEFIRNKPDAKILVFFSSCACVEYFTNVLKHVLKKRNLFAIYGKKKFTREKQIESFRKTTKSVMFSTDVMARGIDIVDIDWVIQFDIPRQSSWFLHRSGRTARAGRQGESLLLLTPQQEAYVQFLENYEKVTLKKIKIPTVTALKAEDLRKKMIKLATNDRAYLLDGTRAFISFIKFYTKHDCKVVCSMKELDMVGHAHAYGLLRIPRLGETKDRDLSAFKRSDVDTSTIKFQDKAREKRRLEEREKKALELEAEATQGDEDEEQGDEAKEKPRKGKKRSAKEIKEEQAKKKRLNKEKAREHKELESDAKLLQKFKKGRLSKSELDNLV
ncbi:hypothetical protein QR680_013145 [Steinernema hermaphroditum]|uniref:ATP-dependent RNA helicase n=1 Tax=Steinernema hermaphroditum TaxID=289476 RepID=A0AA39M1T6_9BILA|nr:hypothetical protein QR680_013145 [Steinernema hermaphroditum]